MSSCCVFGCQNRKSKNSDLKFYRIPATASQRQLWLNAIRRRDWTETIIKNAHVCSAHFISGEPSLDKDSPDFVPSVFSYGQQSSRAEEKLRRLERKRKRESLTVDKEAPCLADDNPVTPEQLEEEARSRKRSTTFSEQSIANSVLSMST
ncbi:hypothetical protein GJAV_G00014090 [Gymnothorax javanicus]|nr:hypothetical protein GJAV_G00014090 [Gymnothorax javanicus]